ncbi:MAG: SDR family NAD(P)-dependent oxidoreductase, partial [Saprospiraceae bacterium]|nr:SDR family NAD(P)-dependent oxidoreductase [Saprospiraceae bacterium]
MNEILKNKTAIITGGSRGIGLAIAKKLAMEGVNVVVASKTTEPHPKLPGTIYEAAEEIKALGGNALALVLDLRDELQIQKVVDDTVAHFGG